MLSGLAALSILMIAIASSAGAATLQTSGGQLMGAFNVDVNGALYDVQFIDGTCVGLFDGCDQPSDLPFTMDGLQAANEALRDQVFLDGALGNFDSQPELTNGCSETNFCEITTPFELHDLGVFRGGFQNGDVGDLVISFHTPPTDINLDTTAVQWETYAVWTLVPEPAAAPLLLSALAVLAGLRRYH